MYSELFSTEKIEQAVRNRIARESLEQGMERGIEQGIERGFIYGREQTVKETVKTMITTGMPDEQIAQISGVDMQRVITLRQELEG